MCHQHQAVPVVVSTEAALESLSAATGFSSLATPLPSPGDDGGTASAAVAEVVMGTPSSTGT